MSFGQVFHELKEQEWVDLPKGWLQGRTIFGGLSTALMIEKARLAVNDPTKRLLSISITFVGPVQEKPVNVTVEVLRRGKSVTTVEARIWQDEEVKSILLASFGAERESVIQVAQQRIAPDYPPAEELKILNYHPLMPQCYQNFDLAWAEGGYPCTHAAQPDFGGWFRFAESKFEHGAMGTHEFLALLDIWPAGVFSVLKVPAPGSSLTWNVTLLEPIQYDRLAWFKYKVFTDYAAHGYAAEYAHIWDADNHLIAISRQVVTVFA